jgi:predicted enzyme related to lactoylglutathione lyase
VIKTSADDTAIKAKALGGKLAREPFDVMDVGRMAVIEDPTGAVFAIWESKKHIGAQLVNEHGALTWNELMTTDVDKAGKFYTHLFDWGSDTADMGGFTYTSFMNGDRPAGGMMQIDPKTMGDVPTHWLVYFAVDDCDAAAEKAKSLGGNVVSPPRDIPEVGRFAVVLDPQGAGFAMIKLQNPST